MDTATLAAELTAAGCFCLAGWVAGWLLPTARLHRERELHRRTRERLRRWRKLALDNGRVLETLVGSELDEALALDAAIRAGESACGNYHGGRNA